MPRRTSSRSAFTLIELLVVIAIIAILAVVVVLTLNPAELLRQSRDANRVSDMATLNSAINLYATDQSAAPTFSLGTATTSYLSVYDPSATSTAGDQCQGIGMPNAAWSYHCAASSTYRTATSTGWIPINLSSISSGSPLSNLPVDPVNQTSSNLYYAYATNGSQYEVSAFMESQKYAKQGVGGSDPALIEAGSGVSTLADVGRGLVGYWPLNEGSGSTAVDLSGNGNTGTWNGASAYAPGKVGTYAAQTSGGTNYIRTNPLANFSTGSGDFSVALWFYNTSSSYVSGGELGLFSDDIYPTNGFRFGFNTAGYLALRSSEDGGTMNFGYPGPFSVNTWYQAVAVYSSSTQTGYLYLNGSLVASGSGRVVTPTGNSYIGMMGGYPSWVGYLDDVRVYNRALSAAEIQELYNAEK